MRLINQLGLVAALLLALGPVPAGAEADVRAEMKEMQNMIRQLQDTVQAQSAQISTQQDVIEEAGLAEERAASSGMAAFLESIEFGGWISASYFYNFNDPDGTLLGGANTAGTPALGPFSYPFKPDANSFSLDQLWFEMEKPISAEDRAGFRADIAFGKTPRLLSGNGTATDGIDVYQAYVQYLAPIGNGVEIKFGKFGTLIGAEVAQAPYNFNITRGNVYNLFQPINHIGVLASTEIGPASVSAGFVNETRCFPACDIDLNKGKAFLWSVGWSSDDEVYGASFNGTFGQADSGAGVNVSSGEDELILDWILSWNPSEDFSAYLNADYLSTEANLGAGAGRQDLHGYGIAVAGRYALSDRLGLAMRGEWADLTYKATGAPPDDASLHLWGITSTVDYGLTEKLLVRGELRYDNGDLENTGGIFFDEDALGGHATERSQVTAGVEVIYEF